MLDPKDIAMVAHSTICGAMQGFVSVAPDHDYTSHLFTCTYYAEKINSSGLSNSPQEIINAILSIREWPDINNPDRKWPGHPNAELVIEYLENAPSTT